MTMHTTKQTHNCMRH